MRIILDDVAGNRDKWLAMRKQTIGSSEIAAICGMSDYDTPLSIWAEKTGKVPPREETEPMMLGKMLEPVVGKVFQRRTKLEVEPANVLIGHDSLDFISASPDFWVKTPYGTKILEAKFTTSRNRSIWDDGIPETYLMQLVWQLCICGIDYGYVAGLVGGDADSFHYKDEQASAELFEVMMEAAVKFWACVLADVPPKGISGDSKLLAKLQGERSAEVVEFEGAAAAEAEIAAEYFEAVKAKRLEAKEQVELLDKEYDAAKVHLMELLGNRRKGLLPSGRVISASTVLNKGYVVEPFSYINVNVKQAKKY